MCFVLGDDTELRIMAKAPWLSHLRGMGCSAPVTSCYSRRSHMASLDAAAAATYSASVVDRETVGCRLLLQLTAASV